MSWATGRSVGREAARRARGAAQADAVTVERHLRKLSRSLATSRHNGRIAQDLRVQRCVCGIGRKGVGPHGAECRWQLVSRMHVRVLRYDQINTSTGEVRRAKRYRVGYYHGGGGFLSVNDGRVSALSIQRILDARNRWDLVA